MKYLLTVLTNNRPVYLERSLRAFVEHVKPHPAEAVIMDDGGETAGLVSMLRDVTPWPWRIEASNLSVGQSLAQTVLWNAARESTCDWVFHLEDDQVILRPVRLNDLRRVLELNDDIKQMTLVRAPWGSEIEHGGYIPMSPGWYERHELRGLEWIETQRNWAFAPSLFRTSITREFDFPERQSETTIGFDIRAAHPEATFGLWGWGEAWCAHVGVAKGKNSHGY